MSVSRKDYYNLSHRIKFDRCSRLCVESFFEMIVDVFRFKEPPIYIILKSVSFHFSFCFKVFSFLLLIAVFLLTSYSLPTSFIKCDDLNL